MDTGIVDKNNRPICSGYIVKLKGKEFKVVFRWDTWKLQMLGSDKVFLDLQTEAKYCEVLEG